MKTGNHPDMTEKLLTETKASKQTNTVSLVSNVWMFSCLSGLNQDLAEDKVSCSRTQHSQSASVEHRSSVGRVLDWQSVSGES